METSVRKSSRQPRVMLVGQGYASELSLRVSLSRLDIEVLPPSSASLKESVAETRPDLLVCVGDEAADGGVLFLRRVLSDPSTMLVPVCVLDGAPPNRKFAAEFRHGMIGHVFAHDDVSEVAEAIGNIVTSLATRTGVETGVIPSGETELEPLLHHLVGHPGLLRLVSAEEDIGWHLVTDDEARAFAIDSLRDAVRAVDSGGTNLHYEFTEWEFGKLHRVPVQGETPVFDERALRGLRMVVIDDDAARAKTLADFLKRYYALVAVRPPQLGIGSDPDLDPECLVISGAHKHYESYRMLRNFRDEARLRWMDVFLIDWEDGYEPDEVGLGRLASNIEHALAPLRGMKERLEEREDLRLQVESLGPCRTLQAVGQGPGVWGLTFSTEIGDVEVNVTEGLILGAWSTEKRSDTNRADGIAALGAALAVERGTVRVRPLTEAHVANIMGPIEDIADEALSPSSSAKVVGLPPIDGKAPAINPKATLLGVAPPAQSGVSAGGLDEPFGGVTMATPSLLESDLADLPDASSGQGLPIQLDSAPPGLELESMPPDETPAPPPPPPPPVLGVDETQRVPALSDADVAKFEAELNTQDVDALIDQDDEDEDAEMATQAIPSMIDIVATEPNDLVEDDLGDLATVALPSVADLANETQDDMEKLAAAARANVEATPEGAEKLDRHSAYPTMRAPALADIPESEMQQTGSLDAPQISAEGGNDENPEFATVRFSALDMEKLGMEPPPPESADESEDEPLEAPVIAQVAEEPKVVGAPPPKHSDSGKSSSSKGLLLGLAAVLVIAGVAGAVMLANQPGASNSATAAPTTDVAATQPSAQTNEGSQAAAAEGETSQAQLADASPRAADGAADTDNSVAPVVADASASPDDAEAAPLAPAVPDAEAPAEEPAEEPEVATAEPAAPAPAPATPTGATVPTPDGLPECGREVRRSQRVSRARSTAALRLLDNDNETAAAEELAVSICADPRNPHAAIGYARLALDRNQAATAVLWARKACDLRGRRDEYRVVLGDALRAAGQPAEARAAYQEALRINRRNADAIARLAAMND